MGKIFGTIINGVDVVYMDISFSFAGMVPQCCEGLCGFPSSYSTLLYLCDIILNGS